MEVGHSCSATYKLTNLLKASSGLAPCACSVKERFGPAPSLPLYCAFFLVGLAWQANCVQSFGLRPLVALQGTSSVCACRMRCLDWQDRPSCVCLLQGTTINTAWLSVATSVQVGGAFGLRLPVAAGRAVEAANCSRLGSVCLHDSSCELLRIAPAASEPAALCSCLCPAAAHHPEAELWAAPGGGSGAGGSSLHLPGRLCADP